VLERHQTLRAVMDWSYNLLSPSEQILLRRLSVFVGGWMLEAAESVCADEWIEVDDILPLLEQLIVKSLVIVDHTRAESRYRMLETIRQYAHEKLAAAGEIDSLRYRHLGYFLDLAEQAAREHYGQTRDQWRDRIDRDDDNFRAALEWCLLEKSTKDALRLLGAWGPHGYHRFSEFHTWFNKIRDLPNVMDFAAHYAGLLNHAASSNWLHGNGSAAKSLIEESLTIWINLGADGELGLAEALVIHGEIKLKEKDIKGAQSLFEQSLEIYQKHGDQQRVAQIIFSFGHKALEEGSYVEAEEQFKKSLNIWRDLGDEFDMAGAYNELGLTAQMQGDYERAGEYYEQCIKILRKRRSGFLSASLLNSAWVFLHADDDKHARLRYEESLKLCREQGDTNGMIFCLAGFACVLGIRQKWEEAARLFGAFESLLVDSRSQLDTSDRKEIDHYLTVVRTQLDGATWKKTWAEGCAMTLDQAIIYALEMG
jgi:tetratricopeptide (TPR) repeat protein